MSEPATVLIAPDSFKGSLSSVEVARAAGRRLGARSPGRHDPALPARRRWRRHHRGHRRGRRLDLANGLGPRSAGPHARGPLADLRRWAACRRRDGRGVGSVAGGRGGSRPDRGDEHRHGRPAPRGDQGRGATHHARHRRQRHHGRGPRPAGVARRGRHAGPLHGDPRGRLRRLQSPAGRPGSGGHVRPAEGRDSSPGRAARRTQRALGERTRDAHRSPGTRHARGRRGRRRRLRAAGHPGPIQVLRAAPRRRPRHGRHRLRREARRARPSSSPARAGSTPRPASARRPSAWPSAPRRPASRASRSVVASNPMASRPSPRSARSRSRSTERPQTVEDAMAAGTAPLERCGERLARLVSLR